MNKKSLKITAIVFSVVLVVLTVYILVNGYNNVPDNKPLDPVPTPTPTLEICPTPPVPTATAAVGIKEKVVGQWVVYTTRNVYAIQLNSDGTCEKVSYGTSNSADISAEKTKEELFEFAMNGTLRSGDYTVVGNTITISLKSGATYKYTYNSKTNTIKATDGTVYELVK